MDIEEARLNSTGDVSVPKSESLSDLLTISHALSERLGTDLSVRAFLLGNVDLEEAWLDSAGNVGVTKAESLADLLTSSHAFSERLGGLLGKRVDLKLLLSQSVVVLLEMLDVLLEEGGLTLLFDKVSRVLVLMMLLLRLFALKRNCIDGSADQQSNGN